MIKNPPTQENMKKKIGKIADMLNFLAAQGVLKKSVILAPSFKKCVELWWKKPSNFKEEKPKR